MSHACRRPPCHRWTVFLENLVRFEAGEDTLATPIEKNAGY